MTDYSPEQYDIDLLRRMARNAAKSITANRAHQYRDDIEGELLLWAWEHRSKLSAYLLPGRSTGERENKLFITLIRQAAKILNGIFVRNGTEILMDEIFEDGSGLSKGAHMPTMNLPSDYRSMTSSEIIELLPLIHLDDTQVPREELERVALVRNAVQSCTPSQQAVIRRLARGLSYRQISDELGISAGAARKRFARAEKDLHRRCQQYVGSRQRP